MKKFSNILKLLTWNNQSFPIGSYCFSSGLEYAVECNVINSGKKLQNWLRELLIFEIKFSGFINKCTSKVFDIYS